MRVLMLSWEFPPYISGGLGTACQGLVTALERMDVEVLLVLPQAVGYGTLQAGHWPQAVVRPLPVTTVPAGVSDAYGSHGLHDRCGAANHGRSPVTTRSSQFAQAMVQPRILGCGIEGGYDGNLHDKIFSYAQRCAALIPQEAFDVIHAHDWITFPAGMQLAELSGKPLVLHFHSTEFDRSGDGVNEAIYEMEKAGIDAAAAVIAVSHLTRQILVERYGAASEKVRVVHNGIDLDPASVAAPRANDEPKTVLFLGRMTRQKGPEYFLAAAARVLRQLPTVRFVMAGWGDLAPRIVEQTAAMGLGQRVFFAGFLRGADVDRAFRMADVYVMPSVSEPFGMTALEAIRNGTPVIISNTAGVAEVLSAGVLKADFWDIEKLAEHIQTVLCSRQVADRLRRSAALEAARLPWSKAAGKCRRIYQESTRTIAMAGTNN